MPTDSSNGRPWIIPETWNSLTPRLRNMYWPGMPMWVYHTSKEHGRNCWYSQNYLKGVRREDERSSFIVARATGTHYPYRDQNSSLPWTVLGTWVDFRPTGESAADRQARQIAQAEKVSRYVMQGYTWESAKEAVELNDLTLLVHTGLHSVELLNPLIATGGGGGGEKKTVSSTGGEKGVKPERMDQIPPDALMKIAEVFGYGADKYSDYNWAKGYEWSKSFAAMQRHLWAFWGGEDLDPESGLPHLAHAGTHIMFLLRFQDQFPQFDDRGPKSIGNNDDPED
jgi:hypothetical protein